MSGHKGPFRNRKSPPDLPIAAAMSARPLGALSGNAAAAAAPAMGKAAGAGAGATAAAAAPAGKTIEQVYQKKTQLEHILLRPDSYSACGAAVAAFVCHLLGLWCCCSHARGCG